MQNFVYQYWIYAIGFAAQGVFGLRMAFQWFLSERKGKVVSPVIFWQLSLLGCSLFLIYGGLRSDLVIIFGQSLAYGIYVRNLVIQRSWHIIPLIFRIMVIALPPVVFIYLMINWPIVFESLDYGDVINVLFIIGALGQLLMNLRFVYQWYMAEKTKSAMLPLGFWYITFLGSLFVLIYAIDRLDPVLLLAQSFSLVSSIRNIQLIHKG